MENEKIGKFICEMRKSQKLTQKNLAEKLGVTDKAVSKWERGINSPDISLLIPLAKALNVTTSELLRGEKETAKDITADMDMVDEALLYSNKRTVQKLVKLKRIALMVVSAVFILAAMICLICDYCISKGLTWSLIVIISLVAGWLLLFPFLKVQEMAVKKSLVVLSVIIIPYLVVLGWILEASVVAYMGACISVISIIGMWCIYAVFVKLRHRKLCAMGVAFLIVIPVTWGITHVVEWLVDEKVTNLADNVFNMLTTLLLAFICFGMDYFKMHKTDFNKVEE